MADGAPAECGTHPFRHLRPGHKDGYNVCVAPSHPPRLDPARPRRPGQRPAPRLEVFVYGSVYRLPEYSPPLNIHMIFFSFADRALGQPSIASLGEYLLPCLSLPGTLPG